MSGNIKQKETIPEQLVAIAIWLALLPFSGYVLKMLWLWFIFPLTNISISIPNALGLLLIAHYLIPDGILLLTKESKWSEEKGAVKAFTSWLMCGLALIIGYVYHLFM